ncbi:MAG: molybdenum cofactor biosynthesis protein MoaE [Actinomycetota bacterium]|jgi:molybdopterin synthase catalytic subunit|nr:molybdenum cofactor biosynthesis protein MoaE [Actinomycetota bacterium]
MRPPAEETWVALSEEPLAVAAVWEWAARVDCGAVVVFTGTVRDHAEGRPQVSALEYEAYAEHVEPRLAAVAEAARRRWPDLGRLALVHRVGRLGVGEVAVVVAAGAPHRHDAFDGARFCIDTIKESVPIWKKETWAGGSDWAPVPGGDAVVAS